MHVLDKYTVRAISSSNVIQLDRWSTAYSPHFPASAAAGSAVGGAGGHYFCVHNKVVLMSALISKAINGSFGAFLSTLFPLLTLSLCSQQCALFIHYSYTRKILWKIFILCHFPTWNVIIFAIAEWHPLCQRHFLTCAVQWVHVSFSSLKIKSNGRMLNLQFPVCSHSWAGIFSGLATRWPDDTIRCHPAASSLLFIFLSSATKSPGCSE